MRLRDDSFEAGHSEKSKRNQTGTEARALARHLFDLLVNFQPGVWDKKLATTTLSSSTVVTATERVISEILGSQKGPGAIQNLGRLIFGGLEDGSELVLEPLLDADIIIDVDAKEILLRVAFSVATNETTEITTSFKDKRKMLKEFDGLKDALKAAQDQAAEVLTTSMNSGDGGARRKRLRRKRRRASSGKDDRNFQRFIKACRYFRTDGVAAIHPQGKLTLFGLMQQALRGDCPSTQEAMREIQGAFPAMRMMKLESWKSNAGKSPKDATDEFLELISSLAPEWRALGLLMDRKRSEKSKPKVHSCVLKASFRVPRATGSTVALPTAGRTLSSKSGTLQDEPYVVKVEVVQWANASGGASWSDEIQKSKRRKTAPIKAEEEEEPQDINELMLARLRSDLVLRDDGSPFSLQDCIIDKEKYDSVDDQREKLDREISAMAAEKGGWALVTTVNAKAGASVGVYRREVSWSPTQQFKSVVVSAAATVPEVFESCCKCALLIKRGRILDTDDVVLFHHLFGKKRMVNLKYVVHRLPCQCSRAPHLTICTSRKLTSTNLSLPPGPLSNRDTMYMQDLSLVESSSGPRFFFLVNSVVHPSLPPRDGHVRAQIRKQAIIAEPCIEKDGPAVKFTFLVNIDGGGTVPSAVFDRSCWKGCGCYAHRILDDIAENKKAEKNTPLTLMRNLDATLATADYKTELIRVRSRLSELEQQNSELRKRNSKLVTKMKQEGFGEEEAEEGSELKAAEDDDDDDKTSAKEKRA